jgi:hypothetical protein
MKDSKKVELQSLFEQAKQLEHGLSPSVEDSEEVIRLYKAAFKDGEGVAKAGNYLARLYQKIGKPELDVKAEKIYKKIASLDDVKMDPMDFTYAQYRLARIKTREIEEFQLQELSPKVFKTKQEYIAAKEEQEDNAYDQIVENIKDYNKLISMYEEFAPNTPAHAKALYNKALLKLKIADFIEHLINEGYSEKLDLKKKLKIDRTAIEESQQDKAESQAKDLLVEAANMEYTGSKIKGYKKAEAELINIRARDELKDKKSHDHIIKLCDKALLLDPKNINSKLLKIDIFLNDSYSREYKDKYYDDSLVLLREILKKDPTHPIALKKNKELSNKLLDLATRQIIENISDGVGEFSRITWKELPFLGKSIPIGFSFNIPYITNKRKEKYFKMIEPKIKKSLEENEYLSKQGTFQNCKNLVQDLFREIWKDNNVRIKKIVLDDNSTAIKDTEENIPRVINEYVEKNSKKTLSKVNGKLTDRDKFKENIINNLNEYHRRCAALTSPLGSDLEVKIENTMFGNAVEAANLTSSSIAGFIGNTKLGIVFSGAVAAMKLTDNQINKVRREALFQAAKNFASIGEHNGQRNREYSQRAEDKFKYIADKLVEIYGMQIDNVDPVEIAKLATSATEKILNHFNNNTSVFKSFSKWSSLKNPPEFAEKMFLTTEKKADNYVAMLLEGIIKGKSRSANADIALKNPNEIRWLVDEIFEKPAATCEGEHIFVSKVSDPEKYGAKLVTSIPEGYTEIKLKEYTSDKIKRMYQAHKDELLKERSYMNDKRKEENAIQDIILNQDEYASKKRKTTQRYAWGIAKVFMGLMSAYSAGVIGFANYLGFHSTSTVALGAFFGISTSIIAPVAVAAFSVVAIGLLVNGIRTAVKAHDNLEEINRKQIEVVDRIIEEKRERTPEELELVEQQKRRKREEIYADKVIKNAKYVVATKDSVKNFKDLAAGAALLNLQLSNESNPSPSQTMFQDAVRKDGKEQIAANNISSVTRRG